VNNRLPEETIESLKVRCGHLRAQLFLNHQRTLMLEELLRLDGMRPPGGFTPIVKVLALHGKRGHSTANE